MDLWLPLDQDPDDLALLDHEWAWAMKRPNEETGTEPDQDEDKQ